MASTRPATAAGPAPRAPARAGLERALDELGDAVAVFDDGGRLLGANRAMREALEDPTDPTLREAVARAVEDVRAASPPVADPVRREVRLPGGTVSLRAAPLPGPGGGGGVLVALRAGPGTALSERTLRADFGLSPQEARVAALLAEGATNEQVAARLNISFHTARHHAGRVLAKLGVGSRAAVAAALLRGGAGRP